MEGQGSEQGYHVLHFYSPLALPTSAVPRTCAERGDPILNQALPE